jgi:hypothetical protein
MQRRRARVQIAIADTVVVVIIVIRARHAPAEAIALVRAPAFLLTDLGEEGVYQRRIACAQTPAEHTLWQSRAEAHTPFRSAESSLTWYSGSTVAAAQSNQFN